MKKRNGIFGLVAALAAGGLLMAACEDFFHEIFEKQPEGDRIISFSVEGLAATVGEKRIDMALPAGAVAPQIEVSPGATLIPISEEYARETFGLEITALWNGLAGADASGSLTDHARSLVQNAPGGFKTPALDKRIDFSKTTVGYLVIAGSGATRLYEVNAATPPLPVPQIIRFDFLVADNPNLAADAVGLVNGNNIDITVTIRRDAWNGGTAAYPLAPTLGFSPADARLSDSGGREIKAGEPFHFDSGHTLLTLAGNRQTVGGELRITYEQEPAPPPPEITRFDFLAADNPGFLAADATGAISGNTISLDLTIRRDVWGAMDYLLIPSFDVSQADAKLFWGGPEIVSGEYLPRRLLPNLQTLALTLDLDGQTVPYMLTIAWLQEPAPPVTFTVNPVAYPIAGMDFLTPLAGQRVATVTAVVGGLQSAADAAGVEIAYESLVGFMANITGEAWLDGIYDPAAGTKTFALMIEYDMGEVFSPNVTLTVRPGDLPPGHGYTGGSVNIPLTIYDGRDDHTNRRAIPLGQDNWRAFHWFAYAAGSTLNYRLIEDIDYAAGDGDGPFNALGPIATRPIHPFNGTFDGGHRRIHGLDISGVPPGVGLFGLVYHGEIRNLRVQGDVSGVNSVGGIVGSHDNPSVGASG
ncbi:MAG: hypothetical protein FWE09_05735, partial [Treponema sp.]|nr:hypothetical protein [Treponema sp.]